VSALPFQVDVRFAVARNTFPVPPGRHEWAADFELPVGGHLLIAGGHLHDYGVSVRLEEVATGKRVLQIESRRDSSGHLLGMPRNCSRCGAMGCVLWRGAVPHRRRVRQPDDRHDSRRHGHHRRAVRADDCGAGPRSMSATPIIGWISSCLAVFPR